MDSVKSMLGDLTEVAVGLIALGVAINVTFGGGAFVPDVIGNITAIIDSLAGAGLVGLVTLVILADLLRR
ncbi:MAG: hypothetical protein VYA80_00475 [Pseudomonadota bacterium]|nr:hypothetical protein [Pseudomonadota bacterium]